MSMQSAITNVQPKSAAPAAPNRGRGRQPVVLKNGKLLSEARSEAKAALAASKTEYKAASATLKDVQRNEKKLSVASLKASSALAKTTAQTKWPSKDVQRATVAAAKQSAKDAAAAHKAASKAVADANKAVEKAKTGVTKAEAAQLKVEESKLSVH